MWMSALMIALCMTVMVACEKEEGGDMKEEPTGTVMPEVTGVETTPTHIVSPTTELTPTVTPMIFEYNPSADRFQKWNLSNEELDRYAYTETGVDEDYDEEFAISVEAEDSTLTGNSFVAGDAAGYSGNGYVELKGSDTGDSSTVTVEIPADGMYVLQFVIASPYGEKENHVLIDGENVGIVACKQKTEKFVTYTMTDIFLTEGSHEITLDAYWGYVRYDKVTVLGCEQPQEEEKTFEKAVLSDPYASENAQRLYQFLCDINGLYTLSGQYGDYGINSNEFQAIHEATGRFPAVLGLDLMDYSPSRVEHGTSSMAIQRAIRYYEKGGIVTFSWHWNAPTKYLRPDKNWWSGFYADATNISLDDIMNGVDTEGYELLISDIDAIAVQLKRLADEDVPILFRPLHEASGGWFWWGDCEAESFKKLWITMYERLTEYHGLHNLIWVYNGQAANWYPGDEYVDIIGEDLYPGERVYASQSTKYKEAEAYTDKKVPIAMSENGCLFDPDLAIRDGARWAWFCTWGGEFVVDGATLSERYTEKSMLEKVYNHESIITLDEVPDLTTYGD